MGIIEKIFRQNGSWSRLKGELSVYYWPRVAGNEIASKVEAVRYRNGFLYLQTENPVLAHQVSLLSVEIVKRFQKILGKNIIKGIKVKIGTVSLSKTRIIPRKVNYSLTEAEKGMIENCSTPLQDPGLAGTFSKLIYSFYINQKKVLDEGGHRCQNCQTVITGDYRYCPCCQMKL
jgi:hypothetical protein